MISLAGLHADSPRANSTAARIPLPNPQAGWISVKSPVQVIGDPSLSYRTGPSGEYEIHFDWKLPSNIDMEIVLNLIYDAEIFLDKRCDGFFGFTGNPIVTRKPTQSSVDTSDSLTDRFTAFFKDPRRLNGIAAANLIKTMGLGVANNTVIIALCSDPCASIFGPQYRAIRHLYFAGCEVNVATGSIRGIASLSSESIFLVATDLLGERGRFWEAVENFACVLSDSMRVAQSTKPALATPVSLWIRNNFINS
jgi:hypothetical protein